MIIIRVFFFSFPESLTMRNDKSCESLMARLNEGALNH